MVQFLRDSSLKCSSSVATECVPRGLPAGELDEFMAGAIREVVGPECWTVQEAVKAAADNSQLQREEGWRVVSVAQNVQDPQQQIVTEGQQALRSHGSVCA